MIIEWVMNIASYLLDAIFMMFGALPDFNQEITGTVDRVFAWMFDGINLLGIFIDFNMVKILAPIVIAILNFDNIAKLIMWIVKKIPILNIK